MSNTPAQEYEPGTVWVPMYLNGQLYMIPIRPKPIQPNPIQPKPYSPTLRDILFHSDDSDWGYMRELREQLREE